MKNTLGRIMLLQFVGTTKFLTRSWVIHRPLLQSSVPVWRSIHIPSLSQSIATTTSTPATTSTSTSTSTSTAAITTTTTALRANFLENLQKSFSTAVTPAGSPSSMSQQKYYTIGITGAGGLVGTAFRDELRQKATVNGKPVRIVRLTRGNVAEEKALEDVSDTRLVWNPRGAVASDVVSATAWEEMDAIVHLSGENVATGLGPMGGIGIRPWTTEKKTEILQSRVGPTQAWAKVFSTTTTSKQRPKVFLTASGVGIYGNDFVGEDCRAVDETMDVRMTKGFLADVSRAWELAAQLLPPARNNNNNKNRVVNMRLGVVLSKKGGALGKLYPIFWLGGGGDVGSGQQYFSYISARDIARAIVHTLETPSLSGPVNMCTPHPCTNTEFTRALGTALRRPTILPLHSFAVSLLFGEMGEEMLLGGVRSLPNQLLKSGFQFYHPTIDTAIQSALDETSI
jgi:uncharacterized protein